MPRFGIDSVKQLNTCHPDLQLLFNEVIKYHDCKVIEGYRNQEAQEKAFSEGKSKLHFPFGKHNRNPSHAVDVAPWPIDWNNMSRFSWFSGFVMGVAEMLWEEGSIMHKIRFGGDWNRNYDITDEHGLRDLVHYEIVL